MDDRQLAETSLSMTEDELLAALGAELTGTSTTYLRDGDLDDLQMRARNWLERNWRSLRKLVCGSPTVAAVRGDEFLELLAVADLIAETWLQRPGAITVAAIICRFGLTRLCSEDPPSSIS